MRRLTRATLSLAAPGLVTLVARAGAQSAGPAVVASNTSLGTSAAPARDWPAPLDRRVSLRLRDVALRTALDRLAAAAHVRLSYSAETLPLDRSVSVAYDGTPLGAALTDVLGDAAVQAVVVGTEHVVLAPTRQAAPAGEPVPNAVAAAPRPAARMAVLDQVVVTGSAAGASERALPFALSVVRVGGSRGLVAGGVTTSLAQGIDGRVPGIWSWAQAPSSLVARYGSIRGASSFGLSAPKVYLDGVEVANPLLVTALAPESVERVEVIRGPQGAAFYGADAISGVINIVTRHDGAADGSRQLDVRGGVGMAGGAYAPRPALTQDHGAALRAGSGTHALGIAVAGSSIGAYVPGAAERHVFGDAYGRHVGSRWLLSGTAYLDGESANTVRNPLLAPSQPAPSPGGTQTQPRPTQPQTAPPRATQSVMQYTLGGTATRSVGERWTHVVTAGVNGYRLSGLAVDPVAVPSAVDSALLAARGGADRGTLRASSVARFGGEAHGPNTPVATTVTLAADWAVLRDATAASGTTAGGYESHMTPPVTNGTSAAVVSPAWLQTTGVSAQATTAWRDALFVTAGLRGERNEGYAAASRYAALPMFGATLVRGSRDVTVKLRTAYGRGLRPARTETRITTWRGTGTGTRVPDLSPEEQQGVEGGVDVFVRGTLSLHATGFDQRASGLIQQVAVIAQTADTMPRGPGGRRISYVLQNVGEIGNRGLELEAVWRGGPLTLSGTYSRVDSRVRRLARGYLGDLRPGDRMLEVPARTLGLDAAWNGGPWAATVGVSRARDWTNYDRLALAQAYASATRQPHELVGAQLRAFWRTYDGVTHLRASVGRNVTAGFGVVLTGDNLLDRQRGEPDNATVLPGRAVGLGVRARF